MNRALDKVAVDKDEKEQAVGPSYVGSSRVKTLEALLITKNFNYSRLESI